MYSLFSVSSKRLVLVSILAVVVFIRNVLSMNMTNAYLHHTCIVSQGRYKAGSEYEKTLKSMTNSIKSRGQFDWGHEDFSQSNRDGEYVSLILQCRADSVGPKCRSCYATALSELSKRCPRFKGGIIWYDQCLFGFSGIDLKRKVDYENNFCMSNANKVGGDQDSFDKNRNTLIDDLTRIAISKQNYSKPDSVYAAGEKRIGGRMNLYGMVQCTKDISPKDCKKCVVYNVKRFQDCLDGKRGGRVLGRSCVFRYELYPFIYGKPGPEYLKI